MPGSVLKFNARKLMFENAPKLFFVSLLYVVLVTLVSWLSMRLPGSIRAEDILSRLSSGEIPSLTIIYTDFRPIGVLLALILSLIQPVLDTGFVSYCMKINRKQDTEYRDIFNGFLYLVKIILIFIITSVLILLWSLLLIIPGIVAIYRYRLAYYILLDDPKKTALQCITESKQLMSGHKLDLFLIELSFFGWFVLDLAIILLTPLPFPVPIVSLWLSPYMGLTRAAFYEIRITGVTV